MNKIFVIIIFFNPYLIEIYAQLDQEYLKFDKGTAEKKIREIWINKDHWSAVTGETIYYSSLSDAKKAPIKVYPTFYISSEIISVGGWDSIEKYLRLSKKEFGGVIFYDSIPFYNLNSPFGAADLKPNEPITEFFRENIDKKIFLLTDLNLMGMIDEKGKLILYGYNNEWIPFREYIKEQYIIENISRRIKDRSPKYN